MEPVVEPEVEPVVEPEIHSEEIQPSVELVAERVVRSGFQVLMKHIRVCGVEHIRIFINTY